MEEGALERNLLVVLDQACLGSYCERESLCNAYRHVFLLATAEKETYVYEIVCKVLRGAPLRWCADSVSRCPDIQLARFLSKEHHLGRLLHTIWVLDQVMRSLRMETKLLPASLKVRIFRQAYLNPVDVVWGCKALVFGAGLYLSRFWVPKTNTVWGHSLLDTVLGENVSAAHREPFVNPPETSFTIVTRSGTVFPCIPEANTESGLFAVCAKFSTGGFIRVPDDDPHVEAAASYLNFHGRVVSAEEALLWDQKYVQTTNDVLFGRIMVANFFSCTSLLGLCSDALKTQVMYKRPAEIYEMFGIEEELTEEEHAELRREMLAEGIYGDMEDY